ARRVTSAAADVLSSHADRTHAIRRMRRALHRLNVTTLIVDGRLATPELAADPTATELLHRYLFDAEISLQGIAKATQDLVGRRVPPPLRDAMANGLAAATDAHLARVHELRPWAELIRSEAEACERGGRSDAEVLALARRVGDLLESLTDALANWLQLGWTTPASGGEVPFQPGVMLEAGGRPTGIGAAARRLAAVEHGKGWRGKISPYLRAPLQVALACAITVPIADAISPPHFYWGIVGVLLAMLGPATTRERVRKTVHRLAGTALGATIGIIVVHLVGHGHSFLIVALIVGSVSVGVLGLQNFYFFFVTFLTIGLVQIYALSTPNSGINWLLTQRVIETGLGLVVGTLAVALLFPLTMRGVKYEAEHGYLNALEQLMTKVAERWSTPGAQVRLRGAARAVDAALYQIRSTLRPVIWIPVVTRNKDNDHLLALLSTADGHARTLAAAADIDLHLQPWGSGQIERIIDTLTASLKALDRRVTSGESGGTWTLASPLIHELASSTTESAGPQADRLRVALDELAALDEVLAILAETRGLQVAAARPDTATAQKARVA
ncbi:MAG TPA: FUSC family protein, partial [Jatrophihabitantaceae bacterium]|nr:FUSC family protein [Jatrophihabitantaceae bacterium]